MVGVYGFAVGWKGVIGTRRVLIEEDGLDGLVVIFR